MSSTWMSESQHAILLQMLYANPVRPTIKVILRTWRSLGHAATNETKAAGQLKQTMKRSQRAGMLPDTASTIGDMTAFIALLGPSAKCRPSTRRCGLCNETWRALG